MKNPIQEMADQASQKMLRSEPVDDREFMALVMTSQTTELKQAIEDLKETMCENGGKPSKLDTLKKHGPTGAAGAGAGVGLASLLAFLRELFTTG